jgi:hypothetical protein
MCVIVKPRNEEAKAPERGLSSHRKKKKVKMEFKKAGYLELIVKSKRDTIFRHI